MISKSRYYDLLENFGVPKPTPWCNLNVIFPPIKCSSVKHLWDLTAVGKFTIKIYIGVISLKTIKIKIGTVNYLLRYKEA